MILPADVRRRYTETVSFREDTRILTMVDRVARNKGSDRTALYREAIRYYLAANSHLTEQEQTDLGAPIIESPRRVEANRKTSAGA